MTTPLPWIKVYGDLPTHRKSVTLAALLNEPRAWTHMVELWLWASRHAPTGDLAGMPDAAIARVSGWNGNPTAFVDAVRQSGFLDGACLHGWHEHNGAHQRKQAADKARNERRASESVVKENPLTSDSLVTHENDGSVESREYRVESNTSTKNLALFADAKVAGQGEVSKPKRGRPPKDQSPEAQAEREAERADADRWMEKARALVGLTADEMPWNTKAFMAFRKHRKARGMEQLMRALEGLESDTFSKTAGLGWLISDNGITKGLASANRKAITMGVGINDMWKGLI